MLIVARKKLLHGVFGRTAYRKKLIKNFWYRVHLYQHNAAASSYGLDAAEKLGLDPARVFKTLVVQVDVKQLAVAA